LDGVGNLGAEFSGVVVSLALGERNTERKILGDLLEISFDGSEESSLWVLLGLGGFGSGGFVSSDVFIRDGIGSNVRKSFKSESASIRNEKSDGKEGGGGVFHI
tara:strand:- start:81 stop:392 length:312 start_codon:yes stop_codon:yes gene_type:complete